MQESTASDLPPSSDFPSWTGSHGTTAAAVDAPYPTACIRRAPIHWRLTLSGISLCRLQPGTYFNPAPSSTALSKRCQCDYEVLEETAPSSTTLGQSDCLALESSPPRQVGTSDYVPTPLIEGTLDYPVDASHSHSEDNQTVDGTMFNATHVTRPPFNVHAFQGAQVSHIDPATTYLPGYGTFVSRKYVEPLELKLQDGPAAEPGDGTSFLTVYTLNKQYGFSRTQPTRTAVPANSVALKCADLPKLIQLYRYFTVPTLSDVVSRHRAIVCRPPSACWLSLDRRAHMDMSTGVD
ncbi:hypothetical protein DFH08DRAFT_808870 [Mycena albidolilacea]|uniref:Uncharacterized protein n=1 Tax=Mycena albidolilacea TaxID=1033008 RepID=A0AAD7A2B7_9AGAR|nr:hypothetical protein DFH08DRAFT_808870 [Mycena albidolilacea]